MRLVFAFLSASALLAAPALAENPAKPGKPVREKKICKSVEVTGSRLGHKRDCRTAAEWEAHRKAVDDANRQDIQSSGQPVS